MAIWALQFILPYSHDNQAYIFAPLNPSRVSDKLGRLADDRSFQTWIIRIEDLRSETVFLIR
jgi:hypothetical protein